MLHNSSQWPTSTLRSIDDRSSTLRPDARSIDVNTARSSIDRYSTTKRNAGGLEQLKEGALPTRSLVALSTPHDHVLEEMMYSHALKSESALPLSSSLGARRPPLRDRSRTGGNADMQARTLNEPANSGEGLLGAIPSISSAPNTKLYDPFDGSPLGTVIPAETHTHDDGMSVHIEGSNEELWTHLSRVLDLQKQIARMHVDMEGVGQGKHTDGKGKGPAFTRPRATSTGSAPEPEIGDEEGVGVDEESEKLKAREREFKKLATQFEGRKEAINEMMTKLDDLSEALTEFHSLQAPKIEFRSTSRNNSVDPNYSEPPQMHARSQSGGTVSLVNTSDSSVRSPPGPKPTPALHFQPVSPVNIATSPDTEAEGHLLIPSLGRKKSMFLPLIIEPDSPSRLVDSPLSTASLKLPSEMGPQ